MATQPDKVLAAILLAMMALLAWGRWRHDAVAVGGLLAATVLGVVPAGQMLGGLSSSAVLSVAALGVLAVGIHNSGVLAGAVRLGAPWLRQAGAQAAVLGGMGAVCSAAMGSHGAASAFGPVPGQVLRRDGAWPSPAVVSVRFALVLGGLVTLVGAAPNLLVSEMRQALGGAGFGLLDFAPVGGGLALAGLAVLAVAWRLLPRHRDMAAHPATLAGRYTSEVQVPPGSPAVGCSVAEVERRGEGAVTIEAVVREEFRRLAPRPGLAVQTGDLIVLSGGLDALQRFTSRFQFNMAGTEGWADSDRVGIVEAVVTPSSGLLGKSFAEGGLARGASLLGIGRGESAPHLRLHRVKLQVGDVLLLQGELAAMPPLLAQNGVLPLAERRLRLGRRRQAPVPLALLLGALALAGLGLAPLPVALLGAVLLLVLLRAMGLDELYASVDWPQVVLAAAMLPLSAAIAATGLAAATAELMVSAGVANPAAAVALVLAATLAVAPLITSIAAVLVVAPIAVALAARLGASLDPFLMAAAVGASCNLAGALAPAPAGWIWPAAWRLGLPLAALVFTLGMPLILHVWPLHP